MSWFKKVNGKCVNTYNPKKDLKYGRGAIVLPEEDILRELEFNINYTTQLNPSICSCFVLSEDKERRNALIDRAISSYHINAQSSTYYSDDKKDNKGNILIFEMPNTYYSDDKKDNKGNILIFEMPNLGGIRKAEDFIVKSMSIDEVDGSHKYLAMTIKHAISIQHDFKALVVKNVENILQITKCSDRYQIMATLVNIQNEFGRPTIFTGNYEGLIGISLTEQHETRFLSNTFVLSDEINK
ncbi:MAG: Unknown protein [uncultured Sulfurovum sp.]|uniref:Uncharacterized protein n=1 Tax=uncultured Sulfurovum sp. TaxID=269237 RepID=A0A6S6SQU4_9BACT|nr:MAG: Unknown protein [uncultured Sulfurovum sp.]